MASVARDLLRGAADLHIHAAPDVLPELLDMFKLAGLAREAGMAAIAIKSHHIMTADRAQIVQKIYPEIQIFGGVALNLPCCGGLNPDAVKTAIRMGGKFVWLPTFSAANQIEKTKTRTSGVLALMGRGFSGKPVEVLDENGAVRPELREILAAVAEADVILATGHLSVSEIKRVVDAALAAGVRKILVNHPEHWMIDMSAEDQRELAARGVMLEKCIQTVLSKGAERSPKILADMIQAVGAQSVVMSTDGGLLNVPPAPQGLLWFIEQMLEYGIPATDIETMVKVNPARLLGL